MANTPENEPIEKVFYPGETYIDDNPLLLEAYRVSRDETVGAYHFSYPEPEDALERIEASRAVLEAAGALDDLVSAQDGKYGEEAKHAVTQYVGHRNPRRLAIEAEQRDADYKTVLGFALNGADFTHGQEVPAFEYMHETAFGTRDPLGENLVTVIDMHPITIVRETSFGIECGFILRGMLTDEVKQFIAADMSREPFVGSLLQRMLDARERLDGSTQN